MATMKNNKKKESPTNQGQKFGVKLNRDIERIKQAFNKDKNYEKQVSNKIEKLEYQISLHKEYPGLKEAKFNEAIKAKIDNFNEKHYRNLGALELKTVSVEEEFEVVYARSEEKRNKAKELDFRAERMNILRAHNMIDKNYHIVGTIEKDVQTEIDKAKKEVEAKYAKLHDDEKAKYVAANAKRDSATLKANKEVFDKAEKEYKAVLKEFEDSLKSKYDEKLKEYTKKEEATVKKLEANLAEEEKKMAEIIAKNNEKYGEYQLPSDVVLRLEGLSMHFGGLKAVDNLTVDIKEGEVFGLIGPNGAGKTTVFNCITQFYKPTFGKVWYKDAEGRALCLNDYAVHNVIKLGIVRTFQNVELIPELTVLQNLLIAAHTEIKTNLFHHMVQTSRVKQEEAILYNRAMKVLEYLDLVSIKDVPPVGLPYGILKKIELARTLMANARVIILDEPAAGLNETETAELARLIKKIQKDFHVTIFLVEHDMGLVMGICDHICAISFGKKLAYGTPQEIQADPYVQEAYLGSEG